jgi:hypothetical protein
VLVMTLPIARAKMSKSELTLNGSTAPNATHVTRREYPPEGKHSIGAVLLGFGAYLERRD